MNMKTDCVLVLLLSLIPKDTPDKQYPLWYSPPVKKEKYTEIEYMNVIIYKIIMKLSDVNNCNAY